MTVFISWKAQRECFSRDVRRWTNDPDGSLDLTEYAWLSADGRHAAVGYPLGDDRKSLIVESFDLKQRPGPAIIGIPLWLAVFWILVRRVVSKRSAKIEA